MLCLNLPLESSTIRSEISYLFFWCCQCCCCFYIWIFFHKNSQITRLQGKGKTISHSSLPLPHASQTLRKKPGENHGDLTFAYSLCPKPLLYERKVLKTKLRVIIWCLGKGAYLTISTAQKRTETFSTRPK